VDHTPPRSVGAARAAHAGAAALRCRPAAERRTDTIGDRSYRLPQVQAAFMSQAPPPDPYALEYKSFLLLLVAVTLAFGWILLPFFGAVFWGAVLAIVFAPLNRRVCRRLNGRENLAAVLTLTVILVLVVLPLAVVTSVLVQEGTSIYRRIQSGDLDFARYFEQIVAALPAWAASLLERLGLNDISDLQRRLTASASQGGQAIVTRAFDIGQNTLDFVVSFFITLYLAFFLLRDGSGLARRIWSAIPLDADSKRDLSVKFATVIRATVKGNILVAAAQGALGGIALWYLGVHGAVVWAVLMAFLSLLPAIGAAIVWLPVAIYFLVTGQVWQGIALIAWGTIVIGLVDNVLRPLLVGKDTKMPDYLVLISTLGGMALFGLNGFVIGPVIAAMFLAAWDIFVEARARGQV
jgi:predicted PurR-regulated permease PerM